MNPSAAGERGVPRPSRRAAEAASLTTLSSVLTYSTNRLRPSGVSRQSVCGRLFLKPFHTSTNPASCNTCNCRLRFPSVSAHSALRSLNKSPSTWLASDARMLSRAFSWITRSSPSYANRPGSRATGSRPFASFCFCLFPAAMPALQCPVEKDRRQQLPGAKHDAHRPRRQRLPRRIQRETNQAGEEVIAPDDKDAARQKPSRREQPEAEQDRPQARQHPPRSVGELRDHVGQQRARGEARRELIDDDEGDLPLERRPR